MLKSGMISGFIIALLAFASGCVPPEGTGGEAQSGSSWIFLGFIALMFVVFYLTMIRPQRRKQKQHEQVLQTLKRGDKVITVGGIFGVVESINEDSLVLKIESGATIRVARNSVSVIREK